MLTLRDCSREGAGIGAAQLVQFIGTCLGGQTLGGAESVPVAEGLGGGDADGRGWRRRTRLVRNPGGGRLPGRDRVPRTAPPIRNKGTSEPTWAAMARRREAQDGADSHPSAKNARRMGHPDFWRIRGSSTPVSRAINAATALAEPAPRPPWTGRRLSIWIVTSARMPRESEGKARPSSRRCCGRRWERAGRWR